MVDRERLRSRRNSATGLVKKRSTSNPRRPAIHSRYGRTSAEEKGRGTFAAGKRLIVAAEKVAEAHAKAVKRRLDHGVSSKNVARLNAMLACIAPHIMRKPDDFNADK